MDTSKTCYLFFDYDGTVLTNKSIAKETVEAMQMAQNMGHMLILNTGRSRGGVDFTESQNAGIHWDGSICGADDIVYHGHQFETHPIPKKYLKRILRFAEKNSLKIFLECEKKNLEFDFQEKKPSFLQRKNNYRFAKKHIIENAITKFTCCGADLDTLKKPKAPISYLKLTKYFEMYGLGKDKGTAILDFCKLTGADRAQCACFGDSLNDLAMFQTTQISIAMKQTPKEIAEFATYRATSDFGVAEGLHWLFDKKELDN